MKRIIVGMLMLLATANSYAADAEVIKDMMKAVLGKEVIAADPQQQIDYWGEYGETNLADGAKVEYISIQNGDDIQRRRSSMATAYLDGNIVKNPEPMKEFCFGMRKTDEKGEKQVVRIDYEPKCWEGRVSRVGKPMMVSNDIQVAVSYWGVVVSKGLSRKVEVEDVFSLVKLERVSRKEVKELRYDLNKGEILGFENGMCIATEKMTRIDEKVQVVADGFVKDEKGAPVAGLPIKIDWQYSTLILSTLETRHKPYTKTVKTDGKGYFSLGIKESPSCCLNINKENYIKLQFYREQAEGSQQLPPLDIRLTPVPAGATNIGRNVSWGMESKSVMEIKSLKTQRGVGLSLDTLTMNAAGSPIEVVKGWTTNKSEADVWFEYGGTDEEFDKLYSAYISTNNDAGKADWKINVTGLRGTKIKEGPVKPKDGMANDMRWTMCEADSDGYVSELFGYRNKDKSADLEVNGKHLFSPNFYVVKDGKYGRIIDLEIRRKPYEGNWNGQMRPITNVGLYAQITGEFNMQTTNLGHRVLQRYSPNE